ncbi:MAG: DUF4394 domain-containing protein [Pleurocapsa minor GSE-CHR-MK-17-07R]|jgi:hypothetical protein|nr:DUF4394 domain-containing protein [Pleurocapsa minor GSE-CHR-MK 17-07R]
MKKTLFALLALFALAIGLPVAAQGTSATVYAVTDGGDLISFPSNAPGSVSTRTPVTGLPGGESILAIDIRPANRQLWALTSGGRIVAIDTGSGAVTFTGGTFTTALNGDAFGLDFNPTVDRIRLTSSAGQDLRLNPNNGAVAAVDGALSFAATDANAGATPRIVASAYTNNFATSTTTTLYNLDAGLDILTIQNPPNNGTQVTVGPLGVNVPDNASFDIRSLSTGTDEGYAAFGSSFYSINLANGAASLIGSLPESVVAIAVADSSAVSAMIPACGEFAAASTPVVRAMFMDGSGGIFCRVLAENRQYTSGQSTAQIGVASVIQQGVIQAVDIFQQGVGMNSVFAAPAQVCLLGMGSFVYLDGTLAPRQPVTLQSEMIDGYTCAVIPNAGTVVLVNG